MKLRVLHGLLFAALGLAGAAACQAPRTVPTTDPGTEGPHSEMQLDLLDRLPMAGFYDNSAGSPIFALVAGAQSSIDIEIYEMQDADVRSALRQAMSRGVRIRVVQEPAPLEDPCTIFELGSGHADASCNDQRKLKDEIIAHGGAYVPFNKEALCADPTYSCFEHGKMVLVDQKIALLSTGNFNSSNLCNLSQAPTKCNRDYTMILRAPDQVAFLQSVFDADLKTSKYDLAGLIRTSGMQDQITVSPFSLDPLLNLIRSAKTSIKIENQYLKERAMNDALIAAAQRGVKVEITVASLCSFGPPSSKESQIATDIFTQFDAAGISVRLMPSQFQIRGKPGYLHAKSMIIDGVKAWVGSVNGSTSATSNNREFGVIFQNPEWISGLEKIMDADHASPDMETWRDSLACKLDKLEAQQL